MIRCGVLCACSAVGNQQKNVSHLQFEPLTAGKPLKRMYLFKLFVTIIGLLLYFVLNQQFYLNIQLLLQLFNRRRWLTAAFTVIQMLVESHKLPHAG